MGFLAFLRYRTLVARRAMRNLPYDEWHIAFLDDTFIVEHVSFRSFLAQSTSRTVVSWPEVERVLASKTDHLSHDTLWLRFFMRGGASCAIPEDAQGWDELLERIAVHLEGAPHRNEWWPSVVQPPFEPSLTQLYPPASAEMHRPAHG
ncbi:hypothetical protein ACQQ2N_14340 [Dokdonella sp. MW10]|uniref:hypothetical protein n=1 Tax=Dokdonella sp. MW10 TaxID=2992926 RepID=UPI003F80E9D6